MRILVVDLESTCWQGEAPKGMVSEIIEVGCAILETAPDKQYELVDQFGVIVRPTRSTVSQYCEDLTGITQKAVQDADADFADAMKMMEETGAKVWGSWGDYDYNMIKEACSRYGVKYRLPRAHLNIKAMFSAHQRCKPMSVSRALTRLGMPFLGKPHRGVDDAINTAEILRHMTNGG